MIDRHSNLEDLDAELLRISGEDSSSIDYPEALRLIDQRKTIVGDLAANAVLQHDAVFRTQLENAAKSGQILVNRLIHAHCSLTAELARLDRLRDAPAPESSLSCIG